MASFQLAQLFVDIHARTSKIQRELSQLKSQMNRQMAGLSVDRVVGSFIGRFIGLQAALTGVMTSGQQFLAFDKNLTNALSIQAGVTDENVRSMKALSIALAIDTGQAAADMAEGFYFLASAGLNVEQQLKAMPIAANFATAGLLKMGEATSILNDAQKSAGLSSKDAQQNMKGMERVADVITKASIISNATVQEMGTAVARAGAAVTTFGSSFEEAVATLAVFADVGKKAGLGATGLLGAMRDLQGAAVKNTSEWKANRVNVFDANGAFIGMGKALQQLEARMRGMSDLDRRKFLKETLKLPDKSVNFVASILHMGGALDSFTQQLKGAAGTTAEVAAKQMEGLGKQIMKFGQQLLSIALNVLPPFVAAIMPVIKVLGFFAQITGQLFGALGGLPAKLLALAAGFALLNKFLTAGFLVTLKSFGTTFLNMGKAIPGVARVFGSIGGSLKKMDFGPANMFKQIAGMLYKISVIGPAINTIFIGIAKGFESIPGIGGPIGAFVRLFGKAIAQMVGVPFGAIVASQFGRIVAGIQKALGESKLFKAFVANIHKIGDVFEQLGRIVVKVMESSADAIASGIVGLANWGNHVLGLRGKALGGMGDIADSISSTLKIIADNWQTVWQIMADFMNVAIFSMRAQIDEVLSGILLVIGQVVRALGASIIPDQRLRRMGRGMIAKSEKLDANNKWEDRANAASARMADNLEKMSKAFGNARLFKTAWTGGGAQAGAAKAAATRLEMPAFFGLEDLQKKIQEELNKKPGEDKQEEANNHLKSIGETVRDSNNTLLKILFNTAKAVPEGAHAEMPGFQQAKAAAISKKLTPAVGSIRASSQR